MFQSPPGRLPPLRSRGRLPFAIADRVGGLLFSRRLPRLEAIKSLVVVRPERLGDVIGTIPALRMLRRVAAGKAIRCLVQPAYGQLIAQCCPGLVDSVEDCNAPRRSSPAARQAALFIDFQGHRANIISGLRQAATGAGYGTRGLGFLLAHAATLERRPVWERHLALLEDIFNTSAEPADVQLPWLHISAAASSEASAYVNDGPRPIVLHPGSGQPNKRWPLEHWVMLGRELLGAGVPLLISGAPSELSLTHALAKGLGDPRLLLPPLPLPIYAGVLQRSRALVAPDSGVCHMAHAVQVPVVALFGPEDALMWGYRSPRVVNVRAEAPPACSPCERTRCRRGDLLCMKQIAVEQVRAALESAGVRLAR